MRSLFRKIVLVGLLLSFFGSIGYCQKTATGILFISDFGDVGYHEALQLAMNKLSEKYHVEMVGKLEGYRELKVAVRTLEKGLVNRIIVMPAVLSENDPFLGSMDYALATTPDEEQLKRYRDFKKIKTDAEVIRTRILGSYEGVFDSNIDRLIKNLTISKNRPQDYVIIIVANSTLTDGLDDRLEQEISGIADQIKEKYKFSDAVGYVLPQRDSGRLNSTGAKRLRTEILGKYPGKNIIFLGYSYEKYALKQQAKKIVIFSTWGGYADISKKRILDWVEDNLEIIDKQQGEIEDDDTTSEDIG